MTINLRADISLKSALNLILEPLHLSYVIKDEVLKITSEQYRDSEAVHGDLQRGRPGDSDSELRAELADGPGRRVQRRDGVATASTTPAFGGDGSPLGVLAEQRRAAQRGDQRRGPGADVASDRRGAGRRAARRTCRWASARAAWAAARRPTSTA